MVTFVKQITTGSEYLLMGTVLSSQSGLNLANLPFFRGNLTPETEQESLYWVVLCDENGEIFGLPASEIVVTEIDGKTPSELLEGRITNPLKNSFEDEPTITIDSEARTDEDLDDLDDNDEDWI